MLYIDLLGACRYLFVIPNSGIAGWQLGLRYIEMADTPQFV